MKPDRTSKASWAAAKERALRQAAAISDAEDKRLITAAKNDPENPPLAPNAVLRKADDVPRKGRGRPRSAVAKAMLTLRVDPGVLSALRRDGPGWQTRLNKMIETYAKKRVSSAKPVRGKAAN